MSGHQRATVKDVKGKLYYFERKEVVKMKELTVAYTVHKGFESEP